MKRAREKRRKQKSVDGTCGAKEMGAFTLLFDCRDGALYEILPTRGLHVSTMCSERVLGDV